MTVDLAAILRWCWEAIRALLTSAHGFAAFIGIAIGVALAEFLAHMLPPGMDSYYADRITRLVCLGVSLCSTFALDATLPGFFLALLAGLGGPTAHGFILRYINARWPNLTPKALIPSPGNTTAPRPLLPATPPHDP
ncbi:MAG TPA: hypothetical protein VJV74_16085 [Terriglobia bacterium]|nr:hypothetical protein [Terriglobia bacterium]